MAFFEKFKTVQRGANGCGPRSLFEWTTEGNFPMQPTIYLCQSEASSPTVSACFYVESGDELYGWRLYSKSHRFGAAFFMLENFYADHKANLYRSVEDDVYGPWISDFPRRREEIRCPLPELLRHELERFQSVYVQEWFFFENDPDAESEISLYENHALPVCAVNIRFRKLSRLTKQQNRWEYRMPGFDRHVLDYMKKHFRFTEIVTEKWKPLPIDHRDMQRQW